MTKTENKLWEKYKIKTARHYLNLAARFHNIDLGAYYIVIAMSALFGQFNDEEAIWIYDNTIGKGW